MSAISDTIKEVQQKLGLEADGIAGRKTWGAIVAALNDEPTIRSILNRQHRQLNRIEKLVGSKRDAKLDKMGRRLTKGTESLSKAVAANQPPGSPKSRK